MHQRILGLSVGLALATSLPSLGWAQTLQSSEDQYVRGWYLLQNGSSDAAFSMYEDAAKAAVLPAQRKKILRAIGEVGIRPGAPNAQRLRAFTAFEEAALLGDGFSLGQLVELQDKNIYTPSNLKSLLPLYETRARAGSATTALLLARIYERGEFVETSVPTAVEWYKVGAQNGSGTAGLKLAIHYAGKGQDKDALRWLKQTHPALSDAQSRGRLARAFMTGEETPRNVLVARRWALSIVSADPTLAVQLLRQILAIEFDLETFAAVVTANVKVSGPDRTTILLLRRTTDGLSSELQVKVRDTLVRLADAGNRFAAAFAAFLIFQDKGFAEPKATDLLIQALKAFEPEAVGVAMNFIASTSADTTKKKDLFETVQRSAQKMPEAMLALANMYSVGGYVTQDPVEGFKWRLRAAQAGDPTAAFETGMAYFSGNGTQEDKKQAAVWLERAKRTGNVMASTILQQIASSTRKR